LLDHFTDLGIGVADAGGVVLTDFGGEGVILVRIFSPAVVFHELTGAVPGGFPFGFIGMRDGWELGVLVGLQVFRGSAEGEVGSEDSGGQEEGFFIVGEELQLLECLVDGDAIGVDFIAAFESLEEIHVFRVFANFAVGEAVHPAAWVLPFSGRKEVSVPGVGEFEF